MSNKDLFQELHDLRDVAHCAAMVGGSAIQSACLKLEFGLSDVLSKPIPMILHCPKCHTQHIDEIDEINNPGFNNQNHRSHLCLKCKTIWRPCDFPTQGVKYISTIGKKDTISFNKNE